MFFSIPNIKGLTVRLIEKPWELPPPDYKRFKDKAEFKAWGQNLATEHHFLSMVEGMTPTLRVSEIQGNPPLRVYGFIIDYDGKMPENVVAFILANMKSEFAPAYVIETYSGHSRLVWIFAEPLTILGFKHYAAFMSHVSKVMHLNMWMPGGIETQSIGRASQYNEQGIWIPVRPNSTIPSAVVEKWAIKAAADMTAAERGKNSTVLVPLDQVHAEIDARWPGKWTTGSFEVGDRGAPFWSITAREGDTNSAVVFDNGMYCFSETAGAGFFSWAQIFGKSWVEKYETDRFAEIIESTAYNNRAFWRKLEAGYWVDTTKEDFTQELRNRGFSSKIPKGETNSDIDKIEGAVKLTKRVIKVAPFLYQPEGVLPYKGKRYLNTSTVRAIEPAPPCFGDVAPVWADCRKHLPFVYRLITSLFCDLDGEANDERGRVQLERWLAWLQHFYINAYQMAPQDGQAIVLAGPTDKGKTLLGQAVLGGLMSGKADQTGWADGSGYFQNDQRFSGERLVEAPIILIDDDIQRHDPRAALQFAARLKKCVATRMLLYEAKFKDADEIPWTGRIVILCNADAESIRMLPNMALSVRDKISLFRTTDRRTMRFFGTREENQAAIQHDLPYLARFLLEWKRPKHCEPPSPRFGVAPYHHPDLLNESLQSGTDGIVLELLAKFMEDCAERDGDKYTGEWTGSYTTLYRLLGLTPGNEAVLRDIRPRTLAISLGNLSSSGYGITKVTGKGGTATWTIHRDLLTVREIKEEERT